MVALDLLSRKPWTRRELARRLGRRGAPAEVAEAVVADLERRGYVDDRAFAAGWTESRVRGQTLGSRRLRAELRRKGVSPRLVEEAVCAAFAEMSEEAWARTAAERRLAALGQAGPAVAGRRLSAYLLRRGFPGEIVSRIVRQVCGVDTPEG